MNKFLNWRFSLIFFHRWLGIAIGLMFLIWSLSGIVLMYAGIPHMTAGERLHRLPLLTLDAVKISPQQALSNISQQIRGEPFRLRISMHNDRPVYRINTGFVFGQWTVVYADTGEKVEPLSPETARSWLSKFLQIQEQSIHFEETLTEPDMFTHSPAIQTHMPMHRFAVSDGFDAKYYVSANSADVVMKTTMGSRLLGFAGYNMHTLFFFRQQGWWTPVLQWISWTALCVTILGVVLGIWRFNFKARIKKDGSIYRSPYRTWHKWHHWTGMFFGLLAVTWVFSGLVSLAVIPGIGETLYSTEQIQAGARSVQGQGKHVDFSPLTIAGIKNAEQRISQEFPVTELELLAINNEYYFLGYRQPTFEEMNHWISRSAFDFITPTLEHEHLLISATDEDAEVFKHFEEDALIEMANNAMPSSNMIGRDWLISGDSYYYHTLSSFDLGLPRSVRKLPVLRLKFNDPDATWLYMEPSLGQMIKMEKTDRINRWGYYALHGWDYPFLRNNRPLWDILVAFFLVGLSVLGGTILVPAYRRLRKVILR